MEALALWEKILLGIFAVVLVVWLFPGLKASLQSSEERPKDWKAVLVPLVLVILFVLLLISLV